MSSSLIAISPDPRSSDVSPSGFLKSSSTGFFSSSITPRTLFWPFPRAVLLVKGLAMNSGCASAL
jgi:hypothetical protein